MIALQLIRMSRQALKYWRELEHDERERLRSDADRVRNLSVELAGPKAKALLRRDADGAIVRADHRDPEVVAAELTEALKVFGVQAGGHAHQIAMDSSRTVRWGTRAGKVAIGTSRRFRPKAPQGHDIATAIAGRLPKRAGQEASQHGLTGDGLADYGRFAFLGADVSGIAEADALVPVEAVTSMLQAGQAQAARIIEELTQLATAGPWEAVGAWMLAARLGSLPHLEHELAVPALRGMQQMQITNLAIHLGSGDLALYEQVTGERPPNDGFLGPPVFATDFGPSRQDYFDHAVLAAAAREPVRVPNLSSVPPENVSLLSAGLWDFGRLILEGPLLVAADVRDEQTILASALAVARGADHALLADALAAQFGCGPGKRFSGWTAAGAARLIEDYLDAALVGSPAHVALVDTGLVQLRDHGMLEVVVCPDALSAFELQRLGELTVGASSVSSGGAA